MDLNKLTHIPVLMNALLANLNSLAVGDLAQIGVTVQSARALIMLRQNTELRCSVLSRLLGLEATTLSHLLRTLNNDGLIERTRVPNDNRAVVVRLTTKGRRIASACHDLALANERTLVDGLEARELQLFERILTRMGRNVTPANRQIDLGSLRLGFKSSSATEAKRRSVRRRRGRNS